MTRRRFEHLAWEAIAGLPAEFRPYVDEIVLTVRRRASKKLRRQMDVGADEELLGLYEGPALDERSVSGPGDYPARIILFYEPLLAVCESEAELIREIRNTVLHEVGHHFGLDEDDLERLGYA